MEENCFEKDDLLIWNNG